MTTTSNTRAGERWSPSPWHVEGDTTLCDADGAEICDCELLDGPRTVANTNLIASSPALYEALQRFLLICEHASDGAFNNGVQIEGSPDQGEVWAAESMDAARAALSLATEGK